MSQARKTGPGSLALDDWRFELKMVCEERAQARVLAELRSHVAGLRVLHPERMVQSIYFDSHEGAAVRENLAGSSQREKLRLRWYGEGTGEVQAKLELKLRRNQLGRKEIWQLDEAIEVHGTDRLRLVERLLGLIPPAAREFHRGPAAPPAGSHAAEAGGLVRQRHRSHQVLQPL
ncbi:MAG: VTC domain-containing protein, partial [Planctomycetota bacterium]